MKPTLDYIRQQFDLLNAQCFEGLLPEVLLRLSRARSYLGQLAFKRRRTLWGKVENYGFVLRISTQLDLPEDEVIDTLLHEMIHLSIASRQLKDTSAHERLFRQMMQDINSRFDRHISISHRRSKAELDQDRQIRTHLICVSEFDSGEKGITIAARSRLYRLWKLMPQFPKVVHTTWYLSRDPFFNRFPRALVPKIYRIAPADLKAHLASASPLMKGGLLHVVDDLH